MTVYYFKIFLYDKSDWSERVSPLQGLYTSLNLATEAMKDVILSDRIQTLHKLKREDLPGVPNLPPKIADGSSVYEMIKYFELDWWTYYIECIKVVH